MISRVFPLTLLVLSSAAMAQDDLRPLKPAIDIPEQSPVWPWLLGAALLLAAGLAAWRWRHRRPSRSPEQRLREGLAAAAAAAAAGDPGAGVDAALAAVRGFVHDTTAIPARYLTADELIPRLSERLPDPLVERIAATFAAWDALRFAGGTAAEEVIPDWIDELVEVLSQPETAPSGDATDDQPQAAK